MRNSAADSEEMFGSGRDKHFQNKVLSETMKTIPYRNDDGTFLFLVNMRKPGMEGSATVSALKWKQAVDLAIDKAIEEESTLESVKLVFES